MLKRTSTELKNTSSTITMTKKKAKRILSLIRGRKKEKSIVPFIDSQLGKPPTEFSFKNIADDLKELRQLAYDCHYGHDLENSEKKFWKEFLHIYDLVYAPTYRAEAKIHPSSLRNSCSRAVYYELSGVEPSNPENRSIDAKLQRIFDTGTWWHTYIQNLLDKSGILIGREVSVVCKKRKINGKGDGIVKFPSTRKKILLEIKSINSFAFGRLGKPVEDHLYQGTIYADVLGLEEIIFLYINKDTCEFKEYRVPVSKELLEEANTKIRKILRGVKRKRPLPRICRKKTDKTALNCQYCNHCFK